MTVELTTTDNAEAKAMAQLRRMVALSPTFASVVPSYAERFDRVWLEGAPNESLAARENSINSSDDKPFAVLWPISNEYQFVAGGVQNILMPTVTIHVYLRMPRDKSLDWNDGRMDGLKFLGNWFQDVQDLFGAEDSATDGTRAVAGEDHLAATRAIALQPEHVAIKQQGSVGDFFFRSWAVTAGDAIGGGAG